jgi:hypothetical protein
MNEHFTLRTVRTISRADVVDIFREYGQHGVMIVVHGFNVSFP